MARTRETLAICEGGWRVLSIDTQFIHLVDADGIERSLDLEACRDKWCQGQYMSDWDRRCVGTRGALDSPPWVAFPVEKDTTVALSFESYDALYEEVLTDLKRAGWHTWDAC